VKSEEFLALQATKGRAAAAISNVCARPLVALLAENSCNV